MTARERTQFRRIVTFTVAGVLALGLLRFLFDPMPAIASPTKRHVPSPNALDHFKAAADQLVGLEEMRGWSRRRASWSWADRGRDWSAWLARNEGAVAKLLEGLDNEFGLPPESYAEGTYASELSSLYPLRRVFRALAEHALYEGDAAAAVETLEAALRFRERLGTCGGTFGRDTANGPVWQVLRVIWSVTKRCDPDSALRAARIIEGHIAREPSFREILEEKRDIDLARMAVFLESDVWKIQMANAALRRLRAQGLPTAISVLMDSRLNVVGSYRMAMQAWIERSERPFKERGKAPPAPESEVAAMFLGSYLELAWLHELKMATQLRALATAFALQAYRLEVGDYPQTLDALVPKYLAAVPADPFDAGSSLRYRRRDGEFVVYSVGPDGEDSGGLPVVETFRGRNGEPIRTGYVRLESSGDMVAGVNY